MTRYSYHPALYTGAEVKDGKVVLTSEALEGWTDKVLKVRVRDFEDETKELIFDSVVQNNQIVIEKELPFEPSKDRVSVHIKCINPDKIPDETPEIEVEGYCPRCGAEVYMQYEGKDRRDDHHYDYEYFFLCEECDRMFLVFEEVQETELTPEEIDVLEKARRDEEW